MATTPAEEALERLEDAEHALQDAHYRLEEALAELHRLGHDVSQVSELCKSRFDGMTIMLMHSRVRDLVDALRPKEAEVQE